METENPTPPPKEKRRADIHLNEHARRIINVALETQREVYDRAARKNAKQPEVAKIYERLAAEIDDLKRSIK